LAARITRLEYRNCFHRTVRSDGTGPATTGKDRLHLPGCTCLVTIFYTASRARLRRASSSAYARCRAGVTSHDGADWPGGVDREVQTAAVMMGNRGQAGGAALPAASTLIAPGGGRPAAQAQARTGHAPRLAATIRIMTEPAGCRAAEP